MSAHESVAPPGTVRGPCTDRPNLSAVLLAAGALLSVAVTTAYSRVPDLLSSPSANPQTSLSSGSASAGPRSRPATTDPRLIDRLPTEGSGTLRFNLFDGVSFTAYLSHFDAGSTPSRAWWGVLEGETAGTFTLVRNNSGIAAVIRAPGKGVYELRSASDGISVIKEVKPTGFKCFGQVTDRGDLKRLTTSTPSSNPLLPQATAGVRAQPLHTLASSPPAVYGCDDGTVIDIMIVYTAQARIAAGGTAAMQTNIDLAIADANAAFSRSLIDTSLRLVHSHEVDYTETGDFGSDLARLTDPSDGFLDDVPPLRDQYGADCVSFWGDTYGGAGVGFYPDPTLQGINASGITLMDWRGYNGLLLAHEIGHNLWCAHDHAHTAPWDTPPHDYSHGYTEPGNLWQEIMGQTPGVPQIPYYANPAVNWPGPAPGNPGPTGVAIGQANPADLYTTIMDTRHVVANFRATATPGLPAVLYVKAGAAPGGNGLSWATALNDLQQALCKAAGSNGAVDQIWVAAGTYRPDSGTGDRPASFYLQNNLALYGGFSGTETNLAQRNWYGNVTILSGDIGAGGVASDNCYHVVRAIDTDSTARLDGFQITGGQGDGGYPNDSGGGLRCDASNPVIANSTFLKNAAHTAGGAYNFNGSAPLYVNCRFLGNQAISYGGGGMENDGCSPTIVNCVFSGNACNWYGAGLASYAAGSEDLKLINCTFSRNTAAIYGGAIAVDQSGSTLANTILWNNTAFGSDEDIQIVRFGAATVTFDHCIVQGWTGSLGGTANNGSAPLFIDDDGADNTVGTPDDNLRLSNGSPAIDTGDGPALPPDIADLNGNGNTAEATPLDLDGHPRVLNGVADRGAYERVPVIPGDFDQDGDVDAGDVAVFEVCATGPGVPGPPNGCTAGEFAAADRDADGDADQTDFGVFQRCLSGPAIAADPNCGS